jgi:glycosyltransferase involved in cell wall biosynthesis
MKVLMLARPDLFSVSGGDTVQIVETAAAIRLMGVEVNINTVANVNYKEYDLLHFFNIIDPEDILGHVYKSKLPYVISPIYVDYREYDKLYRTDAIGKLSKVLPRDTIEYFKTLGKYLLKNEKVSTRWFFLKGHKQSIKYLLRNAALLLPNSGSEYTRLKKDYGIEQRYEIVPNAINPELFNEYNSCERNIVLCVARIEGRKNQLNVIRALNNTNYHVVFIGASSQNQAKYVAQCKSEAATNIEFIDHLPQHDLLNYYNKAKVHVLASWFETTGLSNLEAAAMGCNLVLGDRGDVRDYFGDNAWYCDPGSSESIKAAIDKAWMSEKKDVIQKQIFNNFTWKAAAEATKKAYLKALRL